MNSLIPTSDRRKFEMVEFAQNPEPRCPCILLLDCSGSMCGEKIDELNEGLRVFQEELNKDALASKRVEVTVVKFNDDVEVLNDFETARDFRAPMLEGGGMTSMGSAIELAVEILDERKKIYKNNGISYFRPWIFLITDGCATDDTTMAKELVKNGERNKKFAFFAVGVDEANMYELANISVRQPLKLKGLCFRELFCWLSKSTISQSNSTPEEEVMLTSPQGWAQL